LDEQSLLPSLDQQYYRDTHLVIHLHHQVVMLDAQILGLTRMEYRLLALLVQHAGEVVTRTIILTHMWGYSPKTGRLRLNAHIRGLRRKLGVYADQYIETVIGVGYRFRPLL
jgi:DNA-binding response OmpR family regulator